MKNKEKMTEKELISKYVLPSECKESILLYMEGSLGYDEDYLQEVADHNDIQLIKTNRDENYNKYICGSCGEFCNEYTYNEESDVDECNDCKTINKNK